MKRTKKQFAFDFDGCIVEHKFPRIGEPIKATVEFMHKLREEGHLIIIWTCRSGEYLSEAVQFLRNNKIPFDYVNENPECGFSSNSPKIYADYYIDDRAVNALDLPYLIF